MITASKLSWIDRGYLFQSYCSLFWCIHWKMWNWDSLPYTSHSLGPPYSSRNGKGLTIWHSINTDLTYGWICLFNYWKNVIVNWSVFHEKKAALSRNELGVKTSREWQNKLTGFMCYYSWSKYWRTHYVMKGKCHEIIML